MIPWIVGYTTQQFVGPLRYCFGRQTLVNTSISWPDLPWRYAKPLSKRIDRISDTRVTTFCGLFGMANFGSSSTPGVLPNS
ncbi:MAG: hypothetical protein LBF94_02000 [Puniceicoccales bacterium]|nr:hypothetical protein [Puniceicoccales bacterium]